ncbi:uncharacterized protein LOC110854889 [Folsomia candida]|uniref:Uncharacterized protein n=1 Tax=Folsomia candida TaxID=158441 RepID=A0A226DTW5_FOLCA|nr:uncharacterized protein LOC110854889 [Folsomia candida]OXA48663.1 hypothetical protein Fcan01_16730 [Folsomia candida]
MSSTILQDMCAIYSPTLHLTIAQTMYYNKLAVALIITAISIPPLVRLTDTFMNYANARNGVLIPLGENNNAGDQNTYIVKSGVHLLVSYALFFGLMGLVMHVWIEFDECWRAELGEVKENQSWSFTKELPVSIHSVILLLNMTTITEWKILPNNASMTPQHEFLNSFLQSTDTNLEIFENFAFVSDPPVPLSCTKFDSWTQFSNEAAGMTICKRSDTMESAEMDAYVNKVMSIVFGPTPLDNWTQLINGATLSQEFSTLDQLFYKYAIPCFLILGSIELILYRHLKKMETEVVYVILELRMRLEDDEPLSEDTHRFVQHHERCIQIHKSNWIQGVTLLVCLGILILQLAEIYRVLWENEAIEGSENDDLPYEHGQRFRDEFYVPLDPVTFLRFRTITTFNWTLPPAGQEAHYLEQTEESAKVASFLELRLDPALFEE